MLFIKQQQEKQKKACCCFFTDINDPVFTAQRPIVKFVKQVTQYSYIF